MALSVSLGDLGADLGEDPLQTLPIVPETLAEMEFPPRMEMVDRPTLGGM